LSAKHYTLYKQSFANRWISEQGFSIQSNASVIVRGWDNHLKNHTPLATALTLLSEFLLTQVGSVIDFIWKEATVICFFT